MAMQLNQNLAFVAVAPGGIVALAHNINDGTGQAAADQTRIPDVVFRDNGDFTIVSVTTTTVTVRNDGPDVANCNVLLWKRHTIDRAYGVYSGGGQLFNLSPLPFVPAVGGAGGASGILAFQYVVTGAEPSLSDFFITLPVVQPDANYFLEATLAGAAAIVGIDLPDLVLGVDRTAAQFRFVSTANMTAGDRIDFVLAR